MIFRRLCYAATGLLFGMSLLFQSCNLGGEGPIVLSREAEVSDEYSGWGSRAYYTGVALQEEAGEPAVGNYIFLQIYVPAPGRYYPWAMAAMNRYDTTVQKELKVTITPVKANSLTRVDSVSIPIRPTRALEWMPSKGEKRWVEFPDFGSYFLIIEGLGSEEARIVFDKMLLTNHADYAPTGYALVEDTVKTVLPPAWAFGVLYGGYTDQEETISRIERIRNNELPIDGYWIDSWFWDYKNRGEGPEGYIDFAGDSSAYPNMERLWAYMEQRNIKSGIWIWDAIQEPGNERVFREFEERDFFDGVPYVNTEAWHNQGDNTLIGDIDFENEAAVAHWKQELKPFFESGLDFLKLDRSSAVPFMKAAFEATQELGRETKGRGFILSHLHSTYDPRMKRYPAKWTGDATIAWTQPGYPNLENYSMGAYRENVIMVANPRKSTYEVPFLTHDAGGYNFFGADEQSDSLYMRWIQFSMFNPLTTVFTTHQNLSANLPFNFSRQALDNFRFYSHLKMQLFPYIYTYAHLTHRTGRKMIQGSAAHEDQYLFGRELLVAPIVERGRESREIYLPPGQWIDYYTHQSYSGDQTISYEAPVDRLPLLLRAGSIIPTRPYAGSIEAGSNDTLLLQVFPAGREEGSFVLSEDDGVSEEYLTGAVARTNFAFQQKGTRFVLDIEAVQGSYEGMKQERSYQIQVLFTRQPESLSLNGQSLPPSAYQYDAARQWLTVDLGSLSKTADHRLTVR